MVMSHDYGPVRVAEDDLRSHVDKLVDEKEAALEHLLVDKDAALALGRRNEHDTQQVRRKARPWGVGYVHYRAVEEGVDDIAFLLGNEDVIPPLLEVDAESPEGFRDDSELFVSDVLDCNRTAVHGGEGNERAYFNHVRKYLVLCSSESFHSRDFQEVGADSLNPGAHPDKHPAKLLDVWFAGGVIDSRLPFREGSRHHDIGRTGYGRLVKQHVFSPEGFAFRRMEKEGFS